MSRAITITIALAIACAASPARAATISVTTTAPGVDLSDGACSLREAIASAQGAGPSAGAPGECARGGGSDTIVLAPRATYDLTVADNLRQGANALPPITGDTTIKGDGATIERAPGAPEMRLFAVLAGHLTLEAMTLRGGLASAAAGGRGGAIYSQGFLTLDGVTLTGNLATGADVFGRPLGTSAGGAVANDHGTLVLTNSTLSGNSAGGGLGGAVFNLDGPAVVANSTLVGNTAAAGGALYDLGADGLAGAASAPPATVTLFNSILAGSSEDQTDVVADQPVSLPSGAPNLQRAAVYAGAPNIIQRSGTFGAGLFEGTPIAADPQLGPLRNHGGTGVATLAPRPGSPALGAGQSPGCPQVDARGRPRPPGGCDLGAHEDDPVAAPRVRHALPRSAAFLVVPPHSSPIPGLERGAPARRYNAFDLSHCSELVPLRRPDYLRDARGEIVTRRDGKPFLALQGLVAITPLEALQTPRGVEYQLWGPPSQPLTYSGGVLASALARAPTPLSRAGLARCGRGGGRPAPDLRRHGHVVSYRVEPRSIPARMAYLGGSSGLIPYQNYGRFYAQDVIERAGVRPALDYTPLAWSWVVAPSRCSPPSGRCHNLGGGISRAMLRRGARFVPSAVQPIISLSVTDPRSWVTAVYGRASSGSQRIYGWLAAAHHDGATGRTIRHLACLRC